MEKTKLKDTEKDKANIEEHGSGTTVDVASSIKQRFL